MKTFKKSQFRKDENSYVADAKDLGLKKDEWPEEFQFEGIQKPFTLMDVLDGTHGLYTQGQGAEVRTAVAFIHA